jgi:hypothetical protein
MFRKSAYFMLKLEKPPKKPASTFTAARFIILDPISPGMRRRATDPRCARIHGARGNRGCECRDPRPDLGRRIGEVISRELIRMGAREWDGIGDAGGEPFVADARSGDAHPHRDRCRPTRPARSTSCSPMSMNSPGSTPAMSSPDSIAACGKKRIVRLAEWHFGGGDAGQKYCQLSCRRGRKGPLRSVPVQVEHALQTAKPAKASGKR